MLVGKWTFTLPNCISLFMSYNSFKTSTGAWGLGKKIPSLGVFVPELFPQSEKLGWSVGWEVGVDSIFWFLKNINTVSWQKAQMPGRKDIKPIDNCKKVTKEIVSHYK